MSTLGSANEEAMRLFRIYRTTTQMLVDRGYSVTKDDKSMDFDKFTETFGESPSRDAMVRFNTRRDDLSEKIFVFYCESLKVRVSDVKGYWERMKDAGVTRAVLVYRSGITSMAKQGIQRLAPDFHIEIFQESELLVNITEHVLVPKHVVLDNDTKALLLKKYKIKQTQLPRIQNTDPVARYFGLRPGQVVKIIRPSETAGRYVTYRFVCPSRA